MNLFERYEAWRQARKARKFAKGYDLARNVINTGDINKIRDLENHADAARVFGGYNDFDRGVERALLDHALLED